MIFTIDSSGSIGLANFVQVTSFVTKLAAALDLDDALENRGDGRGFRVGLLTFSTGVSIAFQLNTYNDKALLLQALEVLYMDGTTNTADAIRYSLLAISYDHDDDGCLVNSTFAVGVTFFLELHKFIRLSVTSLFSFVYASMKVC